jgi:hypothetical protein
VYKTGGVAVSAGSAEQHTGQLPSWQLDALRSALVRAYISTADAAPDPLCSCVSCRLLKEAERKTPGFQRLRMAQYDDLRKKLISSHGTRALKGEVCLHVHLHTYSLRA